MSSKIEVPASFAPLVKLELPSPEEYNKRKVALISGARLSLGSTVDSDANVYASFQVSPARMVPTCDIPYAI